MRIFRIGMATTLLVAACKMNDSSVADVDPATPSTTCGGADQPACPDGGPTLCTQNGECGGTGVCAGTGQCAPAVGIDGLRNGDETDVDCGGASSPKCADGKACKDGPNCTSTICTSGVCSAASSTDGLKNGDETDIDCGGTSTGAPKCAVGKSCLAASDCSTGGCNYKKVCVERPSCTTHFGGDTCGKGEPDEATAEHESCCKSLDLPVPTKPVLMDKFHITAGRYRVFLDAVQGNVRKFVQEHRPVGWDPTWDTYVPNGWDVDPTIDTATDPEMLKRYHSSVWHQLGGTALLTKPDKEGHPYRYGCYIQGNGTHTYLMPDDVQINVLQDIPQKYSQDILDAKALNCVTSIMLMAFCEWDWPGSRLPTYAETRYAWHAGDENRRYPWGDAPAPVGFLYPGDVFGPSSGIPEPSGRFGEYAVIPPDAAGRTGEIDYANWKYNYSYPKDPNPGFPDFSAYIAAPGRFPKGNGPFGHSDLAGNVFDLTMTIDGTPGQNPDDRYVSWGRNGAWEGHNIPFGMEKYPYTAPIMRKYGKAGGRCVKDK